MNAANLNKRLTILRHQAGGRAGLGEKTETWVAATPPEKLWASRDDVSDGEMAKADAKVGTLRARFQVRKSARSRSVTLKDRFSQGGVTWAIIGIKGAKDPTCLEWTAESRSGDAL